MSSEKNPVALFLSALENSVSKIEDHQTMIGQSLIQISQTQAQNAKKLDQILEFIKDYEERKEWRDQTGRRITDLERYRSGARY